MSLPILYSFRRCPYAIRARMALAYAGIACELREVSLKHKPTAMLEISPKGTTPVLQLPNGKVLAESLDIMQWAVAQSDPDGWLNLHPLALANSNDLIERSDREFKQNLDRYKYAVRFPAEPMAAYRSRGEVYLQELETLLQQQQFLMAAYITLADIAIFPFVRQFAHVDLAWFEHSSYVHLQKWLKYHEESALFNHVMQKYPVWASDQPVAILNGL